MLLSFNIFAIKQSQVIVKDLSSDKEMITCSQDDYKLLHGSCTTEILFERLPTIFKSTLLRLLKWASLQSSPQKVDLTM